MITPPTSGPGSGFGAVESMIFIEICSRLFPGRRTLPHVPMHRVRVESGAAQMPCQLIRDHHRTVTPAGATDADREIRLALALVLRQKVIQQFAKAPQSLGH